MAVAHQNLAVAYRAHPDKLLLEAYDHASKGLRLLHDMDVGGPALRSRLRDTMLVRAMDIIMGELACCPRETTLL